MAEHGTGDNLIHLRITLNDNQVSALLDTGASYSLIHTEEAQRLNLKRTSANPIRLRFGNSKTTEVKHVVTALVKYGNHQKHHQFYAYDALPFRILLGGDWCKANRIKIDYQSESIHITLATQVTAEPKVKVQLAEQLVIPARSTKWVPIQTESKLTGDMFIKPHLGNMNKFGIQMQPSLNRFTEGQSGTFIANVTYSPLALPKGITLGQKDTEDDIFYNKPDTEFPKFTINAKLSGLQQQDIKNIIHANYECFKPISSHGTAKHTKHHISLLPNTTPIKQRQYPIPLSQQDEVQRQTKQMLKENVIQPSHSPWSSPLLLAKKKTGEWRFCIDFRRVNSATKKDVYPLPRIDDILNSLRGAKYFSTIDLTSGYWQIPMDKQSREITAFRSPLGLYEFTVMPFGLANAPATFQRMMDNTLRDKINNGVLVYIDDIVIYGRTFEEHLKNLQETLTLLNQNGLKCKAEKCCFGYTEIKFLGHAVDSEGIHPDPGKIGSIIAAIEPKSEKEVRSFLGLCSYYRKFVKGFAIIAEPLNKLTRKDVRFEWTEETKRSFQQLKKRLCEAPVLHHFDPRYPIILSTDASGTGIGGVLGIIKDNREHLIACCSRSLNDHERNYGITEMECLAIVWSCEQFRHYLLGNKFTIKTDHSALTWLNSMKEKNRKVARWAIQLSEFNYVIEYRRGRENTNADYLSRYPTEQPANTSATNLIKEATSKVKQQLTMEEEQAKDEWCNSMSKNNSKVKRDEKGLLWYTMFHNFALRKRLLIPQSMRQEIIREWHDSLRCGHMGRDRTIERLSSRFYWPAMREDIIKYIKTCDICQRTRPENQKPAGKLQQMPDTSTPFEIVGIDFVGPLTRSSKGNEHVLVLTDYGTRYAVTKAVRNANAAAVAKFLLEEIYLKFGTPKQLVSDRGTPFLSGLVEELMKLMGTRHTPTTAYHPQCNGLTERLNKTLKNIIKKFVSSHHRDWDEILPFATFAYNTGKQQSLSESPHYLLYGSEAQMDTDRLWAINEANYEYNREAAKRLEAARKAANDELRKSKERNKQEFDAHRREEEYVPGDLVLLKRPQIEAGKTRKFLIDWIGPFKVDRKLSPVNYLITDTRKKPSRNPIQTVNVEHLRLYHARETEIARIQGIRFVNKKSNNEDENEQNIGDQEEDENIEGPDEFNNSTNDLTTQGQSNVTSPEGSLSSSPQPQSSQNKSNKKRRSKRKRTNTKFFQYNLIN